MRNREWRRDQRRKALERVLDWTSWPSYFWHGSEESRQFHARRRAVNPQSCSCWMCGNSRKWNKAVTRQEYSWFERTRDEFSEEGLDVPVRRPRNDW